MNLIYLTSVIFAIYLINQADSVSKPHNGRLVCGFNETGVVKPPATSRLKKDFEHPVRYLQVYIVVDYAAYKSMYFNGSELTVQLIMQVMMTACNELFKPLNLHLVVTGLDIQKVKSSVPKKIFTPEHFEAVKEYTAKRYDKKDYEVLVYLSGYTFLDDVGGIATWRQICRPNNVILVRNMGYAMTASSLVELIGTVAQQVGHTLGMAHDDKDCSCPEKCCVMAASSCEGKRASWSSCSKEALEYWAPGTPDSCLQRPEVGLSAAAICGNGLVEAGETCDCHHHDTQCKACCVKCKLTGTTCYTTLPPKLKKNALTNETRQFVGIFIFFLIIAGVIALIYWYVTSDKSKIQNAGNGPRMNMASPYAYGAQNQNGAYPAGNGPWMNTPYAGPQYQNGAFPAQNGPRMNATAPYASGPQYQNGAVQPPAYPGPNVYSPAVNGTVNQNYANTSMNPGQNMPPGNPSAGQNGYPVNPKP